MAGSSFFLLSKGVLTVLQGNIKSHKRWMTRFYVSMWCDFLASGLMSSETSFQHFLFGRLNT